MYRARAYASANAASPFSLENATSAADVMTKAGFDVSTIFGPMAPKETK